MNSTLMLVNGRLNNRSEKSGAGGGNALPQGGKSPGGELPGGGSPGGGKCPFPTFYIPNHFRENQHGKNFHKVLFLYAN